ncbi:hypothetical protein GF352_00085 [archaeon]|nr:hypothetical protein [archaeon]
MDYFSIAKKLRMDKDLNPSQELVNSSAFLGINPEEVLIKARLGLFFTLIGSAVVLALILKNLLSVIISLGLSLMVYYYLTELPKIKAREERLKSLGHAPEIITVLGTSLELNPNLERGVRLVGENCGGRISSDLSKAYKDSLLKGVPLKESFNNVISEWGEHSQGFKQGMNLINTSLLERISREETIKSALNSFFNNLINDFRQYLARTKTHTLLLFSFGTIIPLIIISMLPVINLLNININPLVITGLLGANLLGIHYYSSVILKKRPPTFSQISLKTKSDSGNLLLYSLILFLVISSPSLIYFYARLVNGVFLIPKKWSTIPLIIGLTASLSTYFYLKSRPYVKARVKAVKAEKELLNITYALGSKLQEKRSLENALKQVIKEHKDKELTSHLIVAYHNMKEFHKEPEQAVMKELVKTGSNRVKSVFKLVFHALRQGVEQSAKSVLRIYQHFNKMIQVEDEHKSMLEQVMSMMKVTAIIFAPLISGFIVIMQGIIESNIPVNELQGYGLSLGAGMGVELMMLILGFYCTGLVVVLTRYQSRLENGPDRVALMNNLSKNVLVAGMVYVSALITSFFII